jgi:hypothetical protein
VVIVSVLPDDRRGRDDNRAALHGLRQDDGCGEELQGWAKLKKGTISVSLVGIKQTGFGMSKANCWFKYTAGGPIVIKSGTGAYTGSSGTKQFTQPVVGGGARLKSGACNESNNAPDAATITWGSGTGTVKF